MVCDKNLYAGVRYQSLALELRSQDLGETVVPLSWALRRSTFHAMDRALEARLEGARTRDWFERLFGPPQPAVQSASVTPPDPQEDLCERPLPAPPEMKTISAEAKQGGVAAMR
jgi:hypothetical protein